MAKVLVIDDEPGLRQILLIHLEGAGFDVATACTATEGLEMISPDIDLVICDMQLPDMNGLEVVSMVSRSELKPPVIVISGFVDDDTLNDAMGAGASKVLRKPFLKEALLEAVGTLVAA